MCYGTNQLFAALLGLSIAHTEMTAVIWNTPTNESDYTPQHSLRSIVDCCTLRLHPLESCFPAVAGGFVSEDLLYSVKCNNCDLHHTVFCIDLDLCHQIMDTLSDFEKHSELIECVHQFRI